jgi:hypothetical protein
MALGTNGRYAPGNVKGTDGRSNFVFDKGDRKYLVRSGLLAQVIKHSSLLDKGDKEAFLKANI